MNKTTETPVYFNGWSPDGTVWVEYGKKYGAVGIGEGELFTRLTYDSCMQRGPHGDAVGKNDVTSYVTIDGDFTIISGERYPIKWTRI